MKKIGIKDFFLIVSLSVGAILSIFISLNINNSNKPRKTRAEETCVSEPTPWFTNYYGTSDPITILPVGSIVEIFDEEGEKGGCFVVTKEGQYGFMRAYGEDVVNNIPGFSEGDRVIFKVNGSEVATNPNEIYFTSDMLTHNVNLSAQVLDSDPPVISTNNFRSGQQSKVYKQAITGIDPNTSDTLSFQVSGLPPGLTYGDCEYIPYSDGVKMQCMVKGTPSAIGQYLVRVVLVSSQGGMDEKVFELRIIK